MPNWMYGDMKLRGEKEDICKFLEENLLARSSDVEIDIANELENNFFSISSREGFCLKGFRRHFINERKIEFYLIKEVNTIFLPLEIAWGVLPESMYGSDVSGGISRWVEVSKEYNLDIKFYGFEMGMEFNTDILIEKGKLIKFEDVKFDDYKWECVMPSLGG